MQTLKYDEIQQVRGATKCCYCNKSGGTSLPSRSPSSPDRCFHFCCEVVYFDIVSWTYVRDGVRTDGRCPANAKPGASVHLVGTLITGPEYKYLDHPLL